jgi:hypothetical protein
MADTRNTQLVEISAGESIRLAELLRQLCREVQNQAAGDMTLPTDPIHRIVAINMMNNVFDRIDAAVEVYLKRGEKEHEQEQGVGLAMTGDRR